MNSSLPEAFHCLSLSLSLMHMLVSKVNSGFRWLTRKHVLYLLLKLILNNILFLTVAGHFFNFWYTWRPCCWNLNFSLVRIWKLYGYICWDYPAAHCFLRLGIGRWISWKVLRSADLSLAVTFGFLKISVMTIFEYVWLRSSSFILEYICWT